MFNTTISNLISTISSYDLCSGITDKFAVNSNSYIKHIVPKKFNLFEVNDCDNPFPVNQTEYFRSQSCEILVATAGICCACNTLQSKKVKSLKRKSTYLHVPAKLNAPISITSPERIVLTLQGHRLENRMLQAQIEELKLEIHTAARSVSEDLNHDLISIMSSNTNITPFMKLFWEEQQKYLKSSKQGIRYHPMIIRYCLGLAAKSPAVYDEIKLNEKTNSGFVILPSKRRLRDYKNYIRPQQSFNPDIIAELNEKIKRFSDEEKFVTLLFDEMKIQENLVWDKHSGDLIGFVALGDTNINYATLNKADQLATHLLVFLVRSIVNPFKYSFANFATTNVQAMQLFPLFRKAVGILELSCNLKVVATTSDGASSNRKFYRMHLNMTEAEDINSDVNVTHRIKNMFADNDRFIYFISDPPHLIKTARNCLSHSGAGSTRYMWNTDKYILWNHISDMFYEDLNCQLLTCPKLTLEHIKHTPFSVMNVRLAAQILSTSVSTALKTYGPDKATRTAEYCQMFNNFFDCLNVRNTTDFTMKRNPFVKPFYSTDDTRLTWLTDVS